MRLPERDAPSPVPDLLTLPGFAPSSVKTEGDTLVIEGYLVKFSDERKPDLHGEFFTRDTDFGPLSDLGEVVVGSYYDHGQNATIKRERVGLAYLKLDDVGVFARHEIKRRRDYLAKLAAAAKDEGVGLGQSSGSSHYLMERKSVGGAVRITAWPIAEASITVTPAESTTDAAMKALAGGMLSYEARIGRVQTAVAGLYPDGRDVWAHPVETHDDHAIVRIYERGAERYERIPYTVDDAGAAVLAPSSDWQAVERRVTYEDAAARSMLAIITADEDARAVLGIL